MKLASMQFKDFTWSHNPRVYRIDYKRELALHKLPRGRYHLQNLGLTRRVFEGEGEFIGETAYSEFKKLASLFYDETPGILVHPLWQSARVYFSELSLRQEPRADFVAYRFVFWECGEYEGAASLAPHTETPQTGVGGGGASGGATGGEAAQAPRYYTVRRGDTLWGIARAQGLTLPRLLELNAQIQNPNRISVGEQVRLS